MKKLIIGIALTLMSATSYADIKKDIVDYNPVIVKICVNTAAHLAGKAVVDIAAGTPTSTSEEWSNPKWVYNQVVKCEDQMKVKVLQMDDLSYMKFVNSPTPFPGAYLD